MIRQTLAALLVAGLAPAAQAAFIYQQTATASNNGGSLSDFSGGGPNQRADNFSLAAAASVLSVNVLGQMSDGSAAGPFTLRLFADAAGSPTAAPAASIGGLAPIAVNPTAITQGGVAVLEYVFNLPGPVALAGGTTYYFSIVSETPGAADWSWYHADGGAGTHWTRGSDAAAWGTSSPNLAFSLNTEPAAVPEPSSLLLFGLVGAGAGAARWRKRRRKG